MNFVLKNRLKVMATISRSGRLKSVAASLEPLNMVGYTIVDFSKNGSARETCVSTSDGFVSIKNFQNNRVTTEVFKDTIHEKTFYYVYDTNGKIVETAMDSQNKKYDEPLKSSRDILTHAPICLYNELQANPQMLTRNTHSGLNLNHSEYKVRSRVA